jgi:hypothetical protein
MLAYSASSYIWLHQGCLIISVIVLHMYVVIGSEGTTNKACEEQETSLSTRWCIRSCVTVYPATIQIHQSGLTCVLCLCLTLPHLYLKKNPSILQDVQSTWIEINVSPYPLKSGWHVVSLCHCQDIVHLVQSGINIKYFVWDQQHNWIKTADMFLYVYYTPNKSFFSAKSQMYIWQG